MEPYRPQQDFQPTINRERSALGEVWLPPTSLANLRDRGRVSCEADENVLRWTFTSVVNPAGGDPVTAAWTLPLRNTAKSMVADPDNTGQNWETITSDPDEMMNIALAGFDRGMRFMIGENGWDIPEASEAALAETDFGSTWLELVGLGDLLNDDRVYVAGFDNGMLWGIRGFDYPAIWTFAEAAKGATFDPALLLPEPPTAPTILNREGEDIGPVLSYCAQQTAIPLWLALGCAKAESGLAHYAERWDGLTPSAQRAIAAGDMGSLQNIINQSGEDISFSYGQQTLQLFTTRPYTTDKAMAVRQRLFDDPNAAMLDMCQRIANNVQSVQQYPQALAALGADPYLGALLQYNSGSYWRTDPSGYARAYGGNIANYRGAISWAKEMVGDQ